MAERAEAEKKEAPSHGIGAEVNAAAQSVEARMAAGTLAVERMLGLSTIGRLEERIAGLTTTSSSQSLPRKYGNAKIHEMVTQPGRTHTQSIDGKLATRTSDPSFTPETPAQTQELFTLLAVVDDATLRSVISTLDVAHASALLFTVQHSDWPTAALTSARIVISCSVPQLSQFAQSGAAFSVDLSPIAGDADRYERAKAIFLDPSLDVAARLALLMAQGSTMSARLQKDGVPLTVGTKTGNAATPAGEQSIEDVIGSEVQNYHATLLTAWGRIEPDLRHQIVRGEIAKADSRAYILVPLATVAEGDDRTALIAALDATLPKLTGDAMLAFSFPIDGAASLIALLHDLSPASRTVLEQAIVKNSADHGASLGLDKLSFGASTLAPKPAAPAPPPPPVLHEVGAVVAPEIHEDHGFLDDGHGNIDNSKRRKATVEDYLEKAKWTAYLEAARVARPDLVDALRAYHHFLIDNDGTDLPFSYEKFVADDKSGAQVLQSAIEEVRQSAMQNNEQDGGGTEHFLMESGVLEVGGGNAGFPYPLTEDWQKAIGAHEIWLEADVNVAVDAHKQRTFAVAMTLHAQDRYNFNPGADDIASGTPDDVNGRFEVTSLGREFLSKATLKRSMVFVAPPTSQAPEPQKKPVLAKKSAPAPKPAS